MPATDVAPETAATLRSAGLRVTELRATAFETLENMPHATAEMVFEALHNHHVGTSIQATYNVLGDLHGAGLVRRIEPAGSPARYERRVGDNHHHLVCRSCGELHDIDCTIGSAPCLTPSDTHGYVLDEAEVIFWGLCPTCRDRTNNN